MTFARHASIFLSFLAVPALVIAQETGDDPQSADKRKPDAPVKEVYDTALGPLTKGALNVLEGSNVTFRDGGRLTVVLGASRIAEGEALPIGENTLSNASGASFDPPPKITIVQESNDGKWLATNGVIGIARDEFGFLEGHEIRIIGGPFVIRGTSFSDTTVLISKGEPKETPSEHSTAGAGQDRHRTSALPYAVWGGVVLFAAAIVVFMFVRWGPQK